MTHAHALPQNKPPTARLAVTTEQRYLRRDRAAIWMARTSPLAPEAVQRDSQPNVPAANPNPSLARGHETQLRKQHVGASVLLVEDNQINQEVAVALLQAAGLQVAVANNGLEAVRQASQHVYQLILMDMQMPIMDGLEATRAIRRLPGHARTPILAMTANAFGDDRAACLDAGMDDHLVKPVEPELLFAMVGLWLSRAAGRPPGGAVAGGMAAATGPAAAPPDVPTDVAADAPTDVPADVPAAASAATPAAAADAVVAGLDTGSAGVAATAGAASAVPSIPGLTLARALLYLPGRDAVFHRVLRQFADQYGAGIAALKRLPDPQDRPAAMRLLHALRGACGAIGAVTLAAQAQALEVELGRDSGTNGPALQAQAAAVQDALVRLVGHIQRHPVDCQAPAQAPGPAAR